MTAKKDEVLKPINTKVAVEISEKHDPKTYFQNRDGLFVWDSFRDRIVAKAKSVKKGTKYAVDSFEIEKYSTDEQIEAVLPRQHIFKENEVCAIIAELISKQPEGEKEELLNNGNFNLFYTPTFVVGVSWDSRDRRWDVSTWYRGDSGWSGDYRVFSPAD